jgi:hypothetical protein
MITQKKVFQKIAAIFLPLLMIGLFAIATSCHGDEERYEVSHKIMYKAEVSAGSNLKSVIWQYHLDPATSISGTVWTNETTETMQLRVGEINNYTAIVKAKAIGANASSTLKVQIYVDGVLKKEVITTGQDLEARADYSVEYKVN